MATRWQSVMMDNYGTPSVALAEGDGVRVTDIDGNVYLDFVGGIAVSSLGHAHPALIEAVSTQVARLAHTSNLAMHEPGVRLAERLVDLLGVPARVFFANSGAEANEAALKLARKHRPGGTVIACNSSFHGRTMGALSVTGSAAKRDPFVPLPGPVTFVDYGDVQALEDAITPATSAIIVEPALGEGGVVMPPSGFLAGVRKLCTEADVLFVVDEVQSGIGRTGHWFASQAEGVRPDVITLAKGLAGGMPIGACVALGAAGGLFDPGDHGSTFGGNPVSCAAALAVLSTIADDGLLDNVKRVGEYLADRLRGIDPLVEDVRGTGLWRGLALTGAHAPVVEAAARARGLLVNAVRPDTIRLAPPLILTEADVDDAIPRLAGALSDVRESRVVDG